MGNSVLYLLACLMFSLVVHASPPTLTYQGRIVKSDGAGFEYNQTRFNFQITGPDGPYSSCVIYDETVAGVDLTNSDGMFDVSIGASHSFPSDSTFSILDAFNNSNSFYCEGGSATVPGYIASSSDGRKLRVRFYDGSSWQTISPDIAIRSVPYAGYALSAQKLGNYQSTDFTLKPTFTSCTSGSFLTWDSTMGFGCTAAPAGGGGGGGSVSDSTYSVKGIVQFDTDAATSGMVYTSSGVAKVNIGTSANQVVALDSSTKLPAVDGSALTNINAMKIQGKTVNLSSPTANQVLQYDGTKFVNASITDNDTLGSLPCADGYVAYKSGGAWTCLPVSSTDVSNSIVSRSGSGGFAAASADLNSLILRDGATAGTVTLSVPTGFTAYNLVWPATGGTTGQVLTKGSGNNLQWATVQSNSLASGNIWIGNASNQAIAVTVSGDATLDSSGVLTLSTTGIAGTYYKVTTDSKGRVTSGSNSLASSDIPAAAGDVSGSFGSLSVDKLKGKAIDSTVPTVDGQIIGWDTTTSKWKISTAIAPANGQVLKWNSTSKSWEPAADATGGSAIDSSYTAKGNVQFDTDASTSGMVYSSSGVAKVNVGTGANQIVALDVSSKLPSVDGSALTNVNATKINGVATSIAALANGQILQYNGTNWVNVAVPTDTLGGMSCATGQVAYYNGSAWVCQSANAQSSSNTLVMRNGSGVSEFSGVALANGTTNVTMAAATAGAAYTLTWPSNLPGSNGMVLASTTSGVLSWASVMTSSLTSAYIFVGNSSNVATGVAMSGDATLANTGALTIASGAITDAKVSSTAALARSKFANGTANGLVINNASGGMTDMTCSSAGQVPSWNGTTWICITPLTTLPSLASAKIWVGNGSNNATAVSLSGDVSITNAGAVTVSKINGVAPTTNAAANAVLQLDSSSIATTKGVNISNGANAVQMRAPASFTTYTMTMPTTAGTNGQFLQTDGSGNLAWASASTGGGGFVSKAADFTVQTTENNYIYAITGVAAVTLPAASSVTAGFKVTFKNGSAGNVTISPSGSDFIDNGQQATLGTNGYTTIVSDGSGLWYVLAGSPTISAATCTSGTQTFSSLSSIQTLTVSAPNAMACKYTITVLGAGGGGTYGGAGGGITISNLKLPSSGTLNIVVGKKGQKVSAAANAYGGGGAGGTSSCTAAGGGGGASAVQINSTILAVAGGGGGGGTGNASYTGGVGGSATTIATAGGGISGMTAGGAGYNNSGGSAGNNTYGINGGAGGSSGASGGSSNGSGGVGGTNISSIGISGGGGGYGSTGFNYCGGGGGGGYGGGGGGSADNMSTTGAGGGGGGGYINSAVITAGAGSAADTTGSAAGADGSVVITWN